MCLLGVVVISYRELPAGNFKNDAQSFMSMRSWGQMRVKAGVLLLCLSAVVYSVEICRRTHVLSKSPPDNVTLHELRLAELRKRLPALGVVGYVSDDPDGAEVPRAWRRFATTPYWFAPRAWRRFATRQYSLAPRAWRRFVTTQYSLAPLILERTTAHELVVGVFDDPGAIPAVSAGGDLLLIEDFGEGVVLFKRK